MIDSDIRTEDYGRFPSPCYIVEERLLRRNLALISRVARESRTEIILAFKAFALWRTFPLFREYIAATTASSLNEARLACEEFGSRAHTYSPAYTDDEFEQIMRCSSHITFNSLAQYERFYPRAKASAEPISCGLRINPEYSEIEVDLYNPCAAGSRFGVTADRLPERLPEGIEGFHCHCHCESDSTALEHTLQHLEARFAPWLGQIEWLNLGGGHLMTREGYDVEHLIRLLNGLHERYPHLRLILEPGSAFAWQTGPLLAQVVDVVEDKGIRTAILNVSFTCHMPDCLEMPYRPAITESTPEGTPYRIGGNSCLSGDFVGDWHFATPLKIGDRLTFEDMNHYTTVKTNMFNGIQHPSVIFERLDGTQQVLRRYTYDDYKERMD